MKKIWIRLILLAVVLFLGHAVWLYYNLDVGESPVEADVIVVPEGGTYRPAKAVQLLNQGYATSNRIIVSPLAGEDFNLLPLYLTAGADITNLIPENQATSTYTNAVNTLAIMADRGFDSALVVTSDYHTRRTRMIYERVNRNYGFDLTYISAYSPQGHYLEVPHLQKAGRSEVLKYYGYLIGLYHFIDFD